MTPEDRVLKLERIIENILYAQLGGHFDVRTDDGRAVLDDARNAMCGRWSV